MEPKLKLNKEASGAERLEFKRSKEIEDAIDEFYESDNEGHTLDLVAKIWDMSDSPEQAMFYAYTIGGFHQQRQQEDPLMKLLSVFGNRNEKPE